MATHDHDRYDAGIIYIIPELLCSICGCVGIDTGCICIYKVVAFFSEEKQSISPLLEESCIHVGKDPP